LYTIPTIVTELSLFSTQPACVRVIDLNRLSLRNVGGRLFSFLKNFYSQGQCEERIQCNNMGVSYKATSIASHSWVTSDHVALPNFIEICKAVANALLTLLFYFY